MVDRHGRIEMRQVAGGSEQDSMHQEVMLAIMSESYAYQQINHDARQSIRTWKARGTTFLRHTCSSKINVLAVNSLKWYKSLM